MKDLVIKITDTQVETEKPTVEEKDYIVTPTDLFWVGTITMALFGLMLFNLTFAILSVISHIESWHFLVTCVCAAVFGIGFALTSGLTLRLTMEFFAQLHSSKPEPKSNS